MSNTRIYVGSLPFSFGDADLKQLFASHGVVKSARVMIDRVTGQSRGFGFVEMDTPETAAQAILALNGSTCANQSLRVNEARERDREPDRERERDRDRERATPEGGAPNGGRGGFDVSRRTGFDANGGRAPGSSRLDGASSTSPFDGTSPSEVDGASNSNGGGFAARPRTGSSRPSFVAPGGSGNHPRSAARTPGREPRRGRESEREPRGKKNFKEKSRDDDFDRDDLDRDY